jgi:NADH-quinone oxidoreductase subunit M
MQGPLNERTAKLRAEGGFKDLNARELFAVGPLIALILVLGVYPKPVIDIINPAVKFTMQDVGQTDPQPLHAAQPGGHK